MIVGYLLLCFVLFLMQLWASLSAQSFLRAHSSIGSQEDLDAFKALARANMYAALAYLVLGGVSIPWGIVLADRMGLVGVGIVLGVYIPLIIFIVASRKFELQSRSLPCADEGMAKAYARISESWSKRLFPDF